MSAYSNGNKLIKAYLNGHSTIGYLNGVKIWPVSEPVPVGYKQYKFEITIPSADNVTSKGILVNGTPATSSMAKGGGYITPWGRGAISEADSVKYVTGNEQAAMYCTTLAIIIEPGIDVGTLTWRPMDWQSSKNAVFKLFGYDDAGGETLIEERETTLVGGTNVTFNV